MKNLLYALKYEIRACLRQISSTVHLNTIEGLLLVAFAILMSAVLGYFRLTGLDMHIVLTIIFAGSFLVGWLSFNKKNADELLSGKKTQALQTLPMDYRAIRFIKMEKLLFASSLLFAAVNGFLLGVILLSGFFESVIWAHAICAMLAVCLSQNLRALLLRVSKGCKWTKYMGVVTLIGAGIYASRIKPDWKYIFSTACSVYTQKCVAIAIGIAGALILIKLAQLCWPSGRESGVNEKTGSGISTTLADFLKRTNTVIRHDLRSMLHSEKERRSFLRNLLFFPLVSWIAALLFRLDILSMQINGTLVMWLMALLIGSGYSGLFERHMTMGYEGGMVLAYVLSGKKISWIQLQRLRGSLGIALPLATVVSLVTACILDLEPGEMILGVALSAANCAAMSCVSAYYLIKGTSYYNDLNRPKFSAGLIQQAYRAALEISIILPVSILEMLSVAGAQYWIAGGYVLLCGILALIYTLKIRRGDTYFYGEYQGVVA